MGRILLLLIACCAAWGADPIAKALEFFTTHQSADGRWDVDGYHLLGGEPAGEPGVGGDEADTAVTARVLLCFLGAGYDQRTPNRHRGVVARGFAWLLAQQRADGSFAENTVDHCHAATALAEACAMTEDPALKEPARRALAVVTARQLAEPGGGRSGWSERGVPGIDTRVSAYAAMAMASGRGAGLMTGEGQEHARRWLQRSAALANPPPVTGGWTFPAVSGLRGVMVGEAPQAGLCCATMLGEDRGSVLCRGLAQACLDASSPDAAPADHEAMMFVSIGMLRVNGHFWRTWQDTRRKALVRAQHQVAGGLAGSWDPQGQSFPGHERGRLLVTALATSALEVYFHYSLPDVTDPADAPAAPAVAPAPSAPGAGR